jgi:hypothetical protein
MIVVTTTLSLVVVGASYAALRVAQAPSPEATPTAPAAAESTAAEGPRLPATPNDSGTPREEPADDEAAPISADDNVSFPVDI